MFAKPESFTKRTCREESRTCGDHPGRWRAWQRGRPMRYDLEIEAGRPLPRVLQPASARVPQGLTSRTAPPLNGLAPVGPMHVLPGWRWLGSACCTGARSVSPPLPHRLSHELRSQPAMNVASCRYIQALLPTVGTYPAPVQLESMCSNAKLRYTSADQSITLNTCILLMPSCCLCLQDSNTPHLTGSWGRLTAPHCL